MSKIYVVVQQHYLDCNIVAAFGDIGEAEFYCDGNYTRVNNQSWITDNKWVVFIDEVEFKGNIVNE